MTNDELVLKITEITGIKKGEVEKVLENMINIVVDTMKKNEKVNITGFGVFKIKEKKERIARNPKTGATVQVPAKRVPKFLPSKNLKGIIN
jgi:nucleoid DNA-binding protein